MSTRRCTLSVLGALALVVAAPAAADRPAVGDPAPPLVATDVDGVEHHLAGAGAGPQIVIFFRGAW